MRVNDDYPEWNAELQIADETSVHAFWKRALKVRKAHDALVSHSKYVLLHAVRFYLNFHSHPSFLSISPHLPLPFL
jgi:glycosidase